jgi:hypothetical protein
MTDMVSPAVSYSCSISRQGELYYKICLHLDFKNNILSRFRFTFYLLKCKKRLRNFLWIKIREPKIKAQFHPNHLLKELTEETDLDEFMNEWIKTDK